MRMRYRVLILILAVIGAGPKLAAQGQFGVKLGPSFGNITNKGVLPSNLKTRTGGAAGLFLGSNSAVIGFGIEGLYAQRGASSDQSLATAETRLDYIDVPVYLNLNIPSPGVRPWIYAGPQISFEVRCRMASGTACATPSDHKTTDYSAVVGGGLRFGGRSLGLSVEARYVYGLTDLKYSTVSSSTSYKNRTFMILLGVGR